MASVSSLDKDVKNLRMSRYTPQAANEIRKWIEGALGEQLKPGDLLDALKDGTALCKLVNRASPSSVRFKESSMPFVQMENISHFLRGCQAPPLNLQSHDLFQTIDLYEAKDPAQVLQCIAAFSRKAHAVQPSKFPDFIGEKSKAGFQSPQSTGGYNAPSPHGPHYGRPRNTSINSDTNSTVSSVPSHAIGGRGSPYRPPASNSSHGSSPPTGGVSSWSRKTDEGHTTPAWNIHQYGYMGGASQGNQGISFGARRQITTAAPKVPTLAEKERKRREQEAEVERQRKQAETDEAQRRRDREVQEERERVEEERRWEEETRRQRELEKQRIQEEKKRWEEEERRWKEEEEARAREEREAEARLAIEKDQKQAANDVRLTGQFLSQYQAEMKEQPSKTPQSQAAEETRIQQLERQLEEAKEREARYERERQERLRDDQQRSRSRQAETQLQRGQSRSKSRTRSVPSLPTQPVDESWQEDERAYLRKQWAQNQTQPSEPSPLTKPRRPLPSQNDVAPPQPSRPLPTPFPAVRTAEATNTPLPPPRPLPSPQPSQNEPAPTLPTRPLPNPAPIDGPPESPAQSQRPLPNPETYTAPLPQKSPRKSPFTRPQPTPSPPPFSTSQAPRSSATSTPSDLLRKPPFANPSSLLVKEMELDRLRQQEWEEGQKARAAQGRGGVGGDGAGDSSAPGGGAWDVHQYGYLGGDSQNRGSQGIGMGAARRQLVGPREPPKREG